MTSTMKTGFNKNTIINNKCDLHSGFDDSVKLNSLRV